MNLLRRLQLHRARAAHILVDFWPRDVSQASIPTLTFRRFTRARWLSRVLARDGKYATCCFPSLNSVNRYFRVTDTVGCRSLVQNVTSENLTEKLPAVESVTSTNEVDGTAVKSDSLLVNDQLSLTKDVLKPDIDTEKTEKRIHLDESKREVTVYVDNAFVKTKAMDLYKVIRKMDVEQVYF